jgi:hypothetical protein
MIFSDSAFVLVGNIDLGTLKSIIEINNIKQRKAIIIFLV